MNDLGWALLGITVRGMVLAVLGLFLHVLSRRRGPAHCATVMLATLTSLLGASLLAASPWPRWSLSTLAPPSRTVTATNSADHDQAGAGSAASAPLPRGEPRGWNAPDARFEARSWLASFVASLARPASWAALAGGNTSRRPWLAWFAAVALAGVGFELARLAIGLISVARLRRRGRVAHDPELIDALDGPRAELGLSREVILLECRELTTPATVGWLRPAILLPAGWREWGPEERRAVLSHELAHIARGDFGAIIWAQLCLALNVFNPLARGLLARLKLDQELAADAWGAALLGGNRVYLNVLATMALKSDPGPASRTARAFLPAPDSFVRRIQMLRDAQEPPRPRRVTISWRVLTIGSLSAAVLMVASLRGPGAPPTARAQEGAAAKAAHEAARRAQCMKNLKHIALAMYNHHSAHDRFPGAAIRDKEGRPLLSWRVAILPYLEQGALYERFHLDEPWDSPHNRALIAEMPALYACPEGGLAPGQTRYQVFAGKGALFDDPEGPAINGIGDGTSKTLLVAEAKNGAVWTQPNDITFDPATFDPKALGSEHPDGFNALFADGAARFIVNSVSPMVLRALITPNGGEVVDPNAF